MALAQPFSRALAMSRRCGGASIIGGSFVRLMSKKVGFLGIGKMGMPMAGNLLRNEYDLVVVDPNTENFEQLRKDHPDRSVLREEVPNRLWAHDLDYVVSMLPSAIQVKEAYLGPGGLLRDVRAEDLKRRFADGLTCIDCSTTGPECSKDLEEVLESKCQGAGAHFVDAPVSGGVPGAQAGTLTFMVGGSTLTFQKIQREGVLGCMGKNVIHCGHDTGAGQSTKLCNNLVLGIHMAAVSEGIVLGQKLGLDARTLSNVFNTSSARCWTTEVYNPCPGVMSGVPSSRDYENGFTTSLILKDIHMAKASAHKVNMALPMGEESLKIYQSVADRDASLLAKDFGAIFKHFYGGQGTAKGN